MYDNKSFRDQSSKFKDILIFNFKLTYLKMNGNVRQ